MTHHHHHHADTAQVMGKVFVGAIVLNLFFVLVETLVGFTQNSLGLLSDAGHNLGDVFSLLLSWIAFRLSRVHANSNYTYGYKKGTVLVSLTNAVILIIAVILIVTESVRKLNHPEPVNGLAVVWTAVAGIVINGITAWMLMKNSREDLNIRGAFLHMLSDTLVSVGVVVAGVVIYFTGWQAADPIVSLAIAGMILFSTWRLLKESLRLSLDGVPSVVDEKKVMEVLRRSSHVTGVHHVHIWAISTTENALTAHVVLDSLEYVDEVKKQLKADLKKVGICHSTLETEGPLFHCMDTCCD